MSAIHFDKPETWMSLVEGALDDPQDYLERLQNSEIDYVCWDCSNLEPIFSSNEQRFIFQNIETVLQDQSIRLYHGCRLYEENPLKSGLRTSSANGIENALISLAENDPVLQEHIDAIKETIANSFYQEQAGCRNNQIWFCLTQREMIEEGGVYIAFGSEYRLLILNGVDPSLKNRLFHYGKPSIVAVELPIEPFLSKFTDVASKFLFSLWVHHKLKFPDNDAPDGFGCYIETDVPAEHVAEIIHPEKAYDQYNSDSRWYSWDEMYLS